MRVELLTCSFRGVGPLNTGVKYASRQMKPTWLRQRHGVTSVTRALLVLGLGQTTDSTDHMTPSASSSLEKKCQKKMCICEHDEKMLIHLCHGKEKPHTRWWKHMVEEKNRIMIGCTCYLPSLHACRSIHISQVVNMGSQEKKNRTQEFHLTSKCNSVPQTDYGTMKIHKPWSWHGTKWLPVQEHESYWS